MRQEMAEMMARAMGGQVEFDPITQGYAVGVTRKDGRYVLIEEDAAARYFDRHACHVGYLTLGSDPRGEIDACEWGNWDGSRRWAQDLAELLGAEAHASGDNIWVIRWTRPDGRFVVIGEESAAIYRDHAHHDSFYDDPSSMHDAEFFEWV